MEPDGTVERRGAERVIELPGERAYVFATVDGVFEPFHALGREVRAGEAAGRIHVPWEPTRAPETLAYRADGILYAHRQPGRVRPGNCCLVVAAAYSGEQD